MAVKRSKGIGKLIALNAFTKDECIPNTKEKLIELLIECLGVESEGGDQDTSIHRGPNPPDDKSKIWFETAIDGFPRALNIWTGTKWANLIGFGAAWPQIVIGDPDNPPTGWTKLADSDLEIPGDSVAYWATFTG